MASSKLASSNPDFNFPEDIIIEILSRLPARSLIELKLVCKAWNLLIKNPSFIAKQFKRSTQNPNLYLSSMFVFSIWDDEMLSYFERSVDEPINLRFPFMDKDEIVIVGISDGLICINWQGNSGLKFLICNPVTRKFHIIPDFEFPEDESIQIFDTSFGFAFDPSSNDYKLVMVMPYFRDQVAIYSMSTNSWRKVDTKVPGDVRILGNIASATIGSVFYWEGYKDDDDDDDDSDDDDNNDDVVIWSFDMRYEMNRVIEGPKCYQGMWDDLKPEVLQLNNELALFVSTSERCYNVWVLNEDDTCWSEKFRISPFPIIERPVHVQNGGDITVAGCSKNGDVIIIDKTVRDDVKLCSYNLQSKEFNILPFPQKGLLYFVFWYTETLLPVKKKDQIQQS